MEILVRSDNSVTVDETLRSTLEAAVSRPLKRFESRLTRIELYLSDENKQKAGSDDKRCLLEARPEGHDAVQASHKASTWSEAVTESARKMERLLNDFFERRRSAERP